MTAEHYFTSEPGTAADRRVVTFDAAGTTYRLSVTGGVFSASRLDPGTAVLLRKAPMPPPDAVGPLLDLGCGYGPVAVVLATACPNASVYAVDVNRRALELVTENAAALGVADRVIAATPDDVPESIRFAEIWSNPPIRIGKPELHALLLRWLPRLAEDGVAWLVVARHLGGDSLAQWLTDRDWVVTRHASQKGYRVLRVDRPAGPGTGSGKPGDSRGAEPENG